MSKKRTPMQRHERLVQKADSLLKQKERDEALIKRAADRVEKQHKNRNVPEAFDKK